MTTPSLPIADHLRTPCWLASGDEWWWPCGLIDHTTPKGDRIHGALVLRVAPQQVTLVVVPEQSTIPARDTDYPAPALSKREPIRIAAELAEAILSGKPFAIGYQGAKDDHPKTRRIDRAIPNSEGTSIYADDLDRAAPRQFKVERVSWVLKA